MSSQRRKLALLGALLLLLGICLLTNIGMVAAQDANPDVVITAPAALQRLSWGAILAGAVLSIIILLGLNLLGIGVGMTTINPAYGDSAEPKEIAAGAATWVAISTLISLFIGGWVAARFAGIPDNVDGLLHGLVTWAVVMLITLFLLTTSVGRIISGISTLISHGLSLAGQAAGAVAQGVANVAQGAAQGIASVAQNAASGVSNVAQDAVDQTPEVQRAMQSLEVSRQDVQREAENLMREAGITPEQVRATADAAEQDVQNAVRQAAQDPANAPEIFNTTLQRILQRGQGVVDQADRDAVLGMLRERTGMSDAEARQTLERWENTVNNAQTEFDNVRRQADQKLRSAQRDVENKVEEVKDQAERTVRDAAQATTKAIAGIAMAVFAALVIGAVAAGIGGLIGAPETLPTAEIDTTAQVP